MAKTSDFAQKLLDDLRLRKEKMAASSQSSSQSTQLPVDAYAYSNQTYRGSRDMKANEIVSSRSGDMLNRSSRSHRSPNIGEVSNQIVPYGRGQSSGLMGDMSLVLAFAFENAGKLRMNDSPFSTSIMGFLQQIEQGKMDFGNIERRSSLDRQLAPSSHFPTFSPVQINEIAKGAQKLNQIRKAYPNGLNVDRYSMEFAKELLQGALDLEESLRMMIDLQKSSEFMIAPQKKNWITLLEEEEDDDDKIKTSEQKQLAQPRFSFDKPLRHSQNLQEVGSASLMLSPITLTYSKEGRMSKNEKQDVSTSKFLSQRQSTSYGSENKSLNALSEQKNQHASAQSNPEKGSIPNVVAKLMGLDNLPEKVESKYTPQKDSGSTQKIEGMTLKHTARGSIRKTELNNKQTENLAPLKKEKAIEAISMPDTREKVQLLGADKNLVIQKASSEVVVDSRKPLWKDMDGMKALDGLEKATIKTDKKHNSAVQMNLIRESQKDVRKQEHTNNREQKGMGRTNDKLLNNMLTQLERARERPEIISTLQEDKESSGSIHHSQRRYTNNCNMNNQKKSQNHLGIQKSYMLLKYGPQEEKHQKEQQVQQSAKQMLQVRPQKGSEMTSNNLSKPQHELTNPQRKQQLSNLAKSFKHRSTEDENDGSMKLEGFLNSYKEDQIRDETSNNLIVKVKEMTNSKSAQISFPKYKESETVKGRQGIATKLDETSVHKLANKKVKNNRKQKIDMPGKIDKVLTGRNKTMLHIAKQVKQQSSLLQEARQRTSHKINVTKEAEVNRIGMFKEADVQILSSNESIANTEPLDVRHQPHMEAELHPAPTLCSPDSGKVQSLQEPAASISIDLSQDVKPVAINCLQDQATVVVGDEEFKSCEIAPNTMNGVHEDITNMNCHFQLKDQHTSEKRIEEPLTESEHCLKWTLVMSQTFLNTVEALFRLNIPFSILQGDGWNNQDEESKLILDCGYEVMIRKGIRQELKLHHLSNISISTFRIRSLDDLVRQLNKDMEKIKFYGRNKSSQVDIEDYLPKMLENDVYNKDPDIECMWDLGWNDQTFAFLEKYDAIRDMEKHILNVLLDEITGELLLVQGGLILNMRTTK